MPIQHENKFIVVSHQLDIVDAQTSTKNDKGNITGKSFPIFSVSYITVLHCQDNIDILGIGFQDGCIGLACVSNTATAGSQTNIQLFWIEKICEKPIKQMCFGTNGDILYCLAENTNEIWLIDTKSQTVLGYVKVDECPLCICAANTALDDPVLVVSLPLGTVLCFIISDVESILNQQKTIKKFINANLSQMSETELEQFDNSDTKELFELQLECIKKEVEYAILQMSSDSSAPSQFFGVLESNTIKAWYLDEEGEIMSDTSFEVES